MIIKKIGEYNKTYESKKDDSHIEELVEELFLDYFDRKKVSSSDLRFIGWYTKEDNTWVEKYDNKEGYFKYFKYVCTINELVNLNEIEQNIKTNPNRNYLDIISYAIHTEGEISFRGRKEKTEIIVRFVYLKETLKYDDNIKGYINKLRNAGFKKMKTEEAGVSFSRVKKINIESIEDQELRNNITKYNSYKLKNSIKSKIYNISHDLIEKEREEIIKIIPNLNKNEFKLRKGSLNFNDMAIILNEEDYVYLDINLFLNTINGIEISTTIHFDNIISNN